MTVKLLTEHHLEFLSLKTGYTGSSESAFVKMPHCWNSHVAAHMLPVVLKLRRMVSAIRWFVTILFGAVSRFPCEVDHGLPAMRVVVRPEATRSFYEIGCCCPLEAGDDVDCTPHPHTLLTRMVHHCLVTFRSLTLGFAGCDQDFNVRRVRAR